MKRTVENVVKKCDVCNKYNYKKKGGYEYVETTRTLEKVGMDLLDLGGKEGYILICIDYFSRYLLAEKLANKGAQSVMLVLEKWCENNKPEAIVTDHGKEFCNQIFENYCQRNSIEHRKIAIEAHGSNGRVERAIRTIREGLLKAKGENISEKLQIVVQSYNNTWHKAIKMTPEEL